MATQTRNPTSDVSFTGTWTGSAGSRFAAVDDHPDSGNPIADGLTHGTTAGEGLFGFTAFSVPAGSTGISVQVLFYDFKNGSQGCNLFARIRCNDTTGHDAGSHNPGNGNANIALRTVDYGANNPKTGVAWTVNDVNGVGTNGLTAFGVASSDANPSITISSILLQVTYTAPSFTGTGAVTAQVPQVAASGTLNETGTIAVTAQIPQVAASGTYTAPPITGTAALEAEVPQVAIAGQLGSEGTSAVTAEVSEVAAVGQLGASGTATVTAELPEVSASGQLGYGGTIAVTAEVPDVSAAGQLGATGTIAVTAQVPEVAAEGTFSEAGDVTGSMAVSAQPAQISATGSVVSAGAQAGGGGVVRRRRSEAIFAPFSPVLVPISGAAGLTVRPPHVAARGQAGVQGSAAATGAAANIEAVGEVFQNPGEAELMPLLLA